MWWRSAPHVMRWCPSEPGRITPWVPMLSAWFGAASYAFSTAGGARLASKALKNLGRMVDRHPWVGGWMRRRGGEMPFIAVLHGQRIDTTELDDATWSTIHRKPVGPHLVCHECGSWMRPKEMWETSTRFVAHLSSVGLPKRQALS